VLYSGHCLLGVVLICVNSSLSTKSRAANGLRNSMRVVLRKLRGAAREMIKFAIRELADADGVRGGV
jgi:hypothetical protein